MSAGRNCVLRSFDLVGSDDFDLIQKIDTFRSALRTRGGGLVAIEWRSTRGETSSRASLTYRVPLLGDPASDWFARLPGAGQPQPQRP